MVMVAVMMMALLMAVVNESGLYKQIRTEAIAIRSYITFAYKKNLSILSVYAGPRIKCTSGFWREDFDVSC